MHFNLCNSWLNRISTACRNALLLGGLAFVQTGCWTVHPPVATGPTVPVFVADYGVHSSVLLPTQKDVYVEYSFGDWAYAVRNYEAPWNAFAALTISLQSALGRTYSPYRDTLSPWPITVRRPLHIVRIDADANKVAKAVAEMDARYTADGGTPVFNYANQGYFRRDSHHYCIFNSCNTMTAHLLEEIGCDVTGWPVLSDFKYEPMPGK